MTRRFEGRKAIVTGGASGIGLAVAKRIVVEGGSVALWDVNANRLEKARMESGSAQVQTVDVTDTASVFAATQVSIAALDGIDILVNCAGIIGPFGQVETLALDEWRKVFAVNLDGVFLCCQAIVPHLRRRGYGRIVMLGSIAGKEGIPGGSAYAATKAAVISLAKTMGRELATSGVIVNAITPGPIETPMLAALPAHELENTKAQIPMHRLGTPDEAAAMICFMASEECSFSTGAIFDLSGGRATY